VKPHRNMQQSTFCRGVNTQLTLDRGRICDILFYNPSSSPRPSRHATRSWQSSRLLRRAEIGPWKIKYRINLIKLGTPCNCEFIFALLYCLTHNCYMEEYVVWYKNTILFIFYGSYNDYLNLFVQKLQIAETQRRTMFTILHIICSVLIRVFSSIGSSRSVTFNLGYAKTS
jgi:hypothetical protein